MDAFEMCTKINNINNECYGTTVSDYGYDFKGFHKKVMDLVYAESMDSIKKFDKDLKEFNKGMEKENGKQ